MDSVTGFLIVLSVLALSGLFTLWQTRTFRRRGDWRAEKMAEWAKAPSDGEAIASWTEEHERQWRESQTAR